MKRNNRFVRFLGDVVAETPFVWMLVLLVGLWVAFAAGIYFSERNVDGASIRSFGQALYWGVAAFSTAGIADTPVAELSMAIGGIWIVVGSTLFFGTIVATVTAYFMRPLQTPAKKLVEAIEYNLEQLDDLSVEELDLLKRTVDNLIVHMERVKRAQEERDTKKD